MTRDILGLSDKAFYRKVFAVCLPAAGLLPCERRLLLRTLKKHFGCHA